MPDPLQSLKAMGAAAIVSTMIVLAMVTVRRQASTTWLNLSCVLGIGLGLVVGYGVVSLRLAWPPVNGLDRLLTITVPLALGIELIAGFQNVPRWGAWLLRLILAATIPRILLHGSVYLSDSPEGWTPWQTGMSLAVCGALLAGVWSLLSWLSQRSPGTSIPLAICLPILCAGLTVMMAGYIKGGVAAFPLVATLVATAIGARLMAKRSVALANFRAPAIVGAGVVGLFGLLFLGRFFGRLSTGYALAMLLTPLLCWVSEMPRLRRRKPWLVGSFRLVLVAIPLLVVLAAAKRDFDRDMAPLLGKIQASPCRLLRERFHQSADIRLQLDLAPRQMEDFIRSRAVAVRDHKSNHADRLSIRFFVTDEFHFCVTDEYAEWCNRLRMTAIDCHDFRSLAACGCSW